MDRDEQIARLEAWSRSHRERQDQKTPAEILSENVTPAIEEHRAVLAVLRMLKDQEAVHRREPGSRSNLMRSENCVGALGAQEIVVERLKLFSRKEDL